MSLDQLLVKLSQAWRVQRQQIQVIAGALAFLVCIVCWERSQWTQPTRPDLLHDLLPSQPAYFPDLATDKLGQGASQHSDVSAWSCEESASWFHHQEHRWPELEEITNRLCQLEHHAAGMTNKGFYTQDRPASGIASVHELGSICSVHAVLIPLHSCISTCLANLCFSNACKH